MTSNIDPSAVEALANLQHLGTPELVTRVVELFKSESSKTFLTIERGLKNSDLRVVRNAAHTLKTSSEHVGAKLLANKCRELEFAARDENYNDCVALGEKLVDLFDSFCVELDIYLSKAA